MSVGPYPAYEASEVDWLGVVPTGWSIKPIAAVASCNDEVLAEDTPDDLRIHYIEISDVDAIEGVRSSTELEFGAAPSRARRQVQNGDVIVSTVRTYLRAIAAIDAVPCNTIASTGFAVFRPRQINPSFLAHVFHAEFLISQIIARSAGVSYPAINATEIAHLKIPVPPPTEQSAIAAFLDHETAKIDALVAEQERLMALLKEKRQAVISLAVTKGLNPNVRMKPSGAEWLGEVPEHWQALPLKRLIREGTSISYGIVQPGEPQDDGVPFVQTTNMSSGTFMLEELQKTTVDIAAAYPRSRLEGGEVMLGIRASIGAAYVVPVRLAGANLSRGVARIVGGPLIDSAFLVAYLSSDSVVAYWGLAKQGSTFNEVSIETVRDLIVPVPPIDEQHEIADSVERSRETFGSLTEEAARAITLLRERRAALISAAVTGKVDVRGFTPPSRRAA